MLPVTSNDRKYLMVIAFIIFFFFSLLIYQFYTLQIIEGEKWSQIAKKQHFFVINEPSLRGSFYSNTSIKKGDPEIPQRFVFDIRRFHLYADPLSIPKEHHQTIVNHLLKQLELTSQERLLLPRQFSRNSHSRKLAMWLDEKKRESIFSWWQNFSKKHKIPRNALFFVPDYQRSYPFGKLLGQILHTVQQNKDTATQQALPTGGLELSLNNYLQGKPGKRVLMRSPRHSFETGIVISEPEPGADIYLTINHCLQAIMEEELEKGVKKSNAVGGWAVMMEPRTGEILALAQYPYFDPSKYQHYFNDINLIEHTKVKAISDANEPGSVMKALTLCILLQANEELKARGEKPLFEPEEMISTADGHFPGRRKELRDVSFHKKLNMWMGIQKSSNIYFARLTERLINRLGNEWYRKALQNTFGLGLKTNIELPSESEALLPRLGKKHPNGTLEWAKATPYSLCIGHNVQITSLQLTRAYAVLANGGYLVEPTLIRKIVKTKADGTQEILLDNMAAERISKFPKVLNSNIVNTVVTAMKYVTKPGGTSQKADIWGYTEAGKSGTPNKVINGVYSQTRYVPDFVGFTPVKDPAFVLAVILDEPEHKYIPGFGKNYMGGTSAAPVFKNIATRSLEYLGITPDDPHGYPRGDPRYDPLLADWIPETLKLQEIYEKWNN